MADSVKSDVNVASIRRVDPYAKKIVAKATHVALYLFDTIKNGWDRIETEGALFIYSRNGEPFHSIIVMNRLNTDNLIEPLVRDFDYQVKTPFLLYKNSRSKIFGIWFFNRTECTEITVAIESIMEGLKDKSDKKSIKKENNVDIFGMLSKAQEDFNKTPTKQDIPNVSSSTPRVSEVASQSVMDFFAKASTKNVQPSIVTGISEENVLQRLMSNPANTVEHIEKQQRSITPQDNTIVKPKVITSSDRRSAPLSFPSSSKTDRKQDADNSVTLIPAAISLGQSPSPLAYLLHQNQHQSEKEENNEIIDNIPFNQFMDSHKPHLMTPMMFTNPKLADNLEHATESDQIDLLTEKQLAQALIYLLKNNSDFTRQIHEAYVKSINEKVNLSINKSLI